MSEKYYVVAEANKIQDLIFRSSRLKEVMNGSSLLKHFCEQLRINDNLKKLLGKKFSQNDPELTGSIIISSGGNFLLEFSSMEMAEEFIQNLTELYRMLLGGTLTAIIIPSSSITSHSNGNNGNNSNFFSNLYKKLYSVKHQGQEPSSLCHIPYMEVCQSCGIDVATERTLENDKEKLLCRSCSRKRNISGNFMKKKIMENLGAHKDEVQFYMDIDKFAKETDPKNNIAYIIADGNNIGSLFGEKQTSEEISNFSKSLSKIMLKSIMSPIKSWLKNNPLSEDNLIKDENENRPIIPIIPLILGGDDIFSIVPARWGIDFAKKLVTSFETEMSNMESNNLKITMSAAVVICKASFPYKIAHQIGEELLRKAKFRAKTSKPQTSTISIKLIKNRGMFKEAESNQNISLNYPAFSIEEIDWQLENRLKLKNFSNTKKNELIESYYTIIERFKEIHDQNLQTKKKIMEISGKVMKEYLKRIFDNELEPNFNEELRKLLYYHSSTGQDDDNEEFSIWEYSPKDDKYYSRAFQLFKLWDYLYKINEKISNYGGKNN